MPILAREPTVPLREHLEILRRHDRRADDRFQLERDRRYTEVALEREKALKIKETADLAALQLAREIQTYKDEKANELRSQIERERGTYVTQTEMRALTEKVDLALKPMSDYIAAQQGRSGGLSAGWGYLVGAITVVAIIVNLVFYIAFINQ